jgi:hypothetical protein
LLIVNLFSTSLDTHSTFPKTRNPLLHEKLVMEQWNEDDSSESSASDIHNYDDDDFIINDTSVSDVSGPDEVDVFKETAQETVQETVIGTRASADPKRE